MATRERDILAALDVVQGPARSVLGASEPPGTITAIPGLGASLPQNPQLRAQDPRPELPVVELQAAPPPLVRVPDHEPEIFEALANLQRLAGGDAESLDEDVGIMAIQLDRVSGAPLGSRFAVSSVVSPDDRLRALQMRFPLAVPVPNTTNFIYLDPETGEPVLFDDDGFGIGDVADVAPAITETGGMVLGGAAGAAVGGLPGAVAGSGLGGAVGRRFGQLTGQQATGSQDTRSEAEQLLSSAGSAALGAGAALAGPAVGALARGAAAQTARAAALRPRNLAASAARIEDAIRGASGQTPAQMARAAQAVAGREGPAATAYHLATRAPVASRPAIALRDMRRGMSASDWDAVAGHVWSEMASTGAGSTTAQAMATNIGNMRPAVRRALFGETRYAPALAAMDDLARTLPSTTKNHTTQALKIVAPLLGSLTGMSAGFGGVAGALGGGALGAGSLAALRNAIPSVLASPAFVTWAARGADILNRSPGALPSIMARLPFIANAEPWLEQSLRQLYPRAFDESLQQDVRNPAPSAGRR